MRTDLDPRGGDARVRAGRSPRSKSIFPRWRIGPALIFIDKDVAAH
jgi:hypothetical protein